MSVLVSDEDEDEDEEDVMDAPFASLFPPLAAAAAAAATAAAAAIAALTAAEDVAAEREAVDGLPVPFPFMLLWW